MAICEMGPGLVQQLGSGGVFMPTASNVIRCTSSRAVAGRNYMILAGYYDSAASADRDLSLNTGGNRLGPYAQGWDPSTGQFVMFALRSTDPVKALLPLEGFGFTVGTARGAGSAAVPTQPAPPARPAVPTAGPPGRSQPSDGYLPSFTCNYDVLCDAAGNVIEGPKSGVRLGNGQICAGFGCTRP
jgi:hypothetical protein